MDAGVLETDTTLCEESVPLLPWQRTAVIVAHYVSVKSISPIFMILALATE